MVRIALFGSPRVTSLDGTREFPLPRKTLNVLAYVLLHANRPPTRDTVAFALFPDEEEERARGSLRRNLSYLLSSLPPTGAGEPFVLADGDRIAWNAAAPAVVDVFVFERALAEGRDDDALAAYTGLLLPTLYDEWTISDRERLREAANDALARNIARDRSRRQFDAAAAAARRLLEDDPWREDVVRQWMAVRYEAGDRAGALAVFTGFAGRLRVEMAADPMVETVAMRDAILRGARLATSETSRPAVEQPVALPFVGREHALARALECWHRSADGRATALFVGGEAGIGKSRFVAELARALEREGGFTLIGETSAGGERRPYEAVIEALRDAKRALVERLFDEHQDAAPGDERAARRRLFEAVAGAFADLARVRPLAIVLEDVHWAGAATVDLVAYLLERLATARVLVVVTLRDDELPRPHSLRELIRTVEARGRCERLELTRLPAGDAARAAHAVAPSEAGSDVVERAVAWAGGIPLLLDEAMRDVRAGRTLGERGDFTAVLEERFARLEPPAQAALAYAAVIGTRFDLETLGAAIGWRDDEIVDALGPALESGLIRAGSPKRGLTFTFSHHLVHAAALSRVAPSDRARAHLLVARALRALFAGGERALEIADHYVAAGHDALAVEHYAAGARYALEVFANADARDAATSGLAHLGTAAADRDLRYQLLATRESALARLGETDARRADAEALCELAGTDETRLLDALDRLTRAVRGDQAAREQAFECLRILGEGNPRARAIYELRLAEEASLDNDLRRAADLGVQAAAHFTELGDRTAALRAQLTRMNALYHLGAVAEASALIASERPGIEELADATLQLEFYLGASKVDDERRREAGLADAERALALAQRIGDRFGEARAQTNIGYFANVLGDEERSLTAYERSIALLTSIGMQREGITTMINLAGAFGWNGDFARALRLLDEVDAIGGEPWHRFHALANRAAIMLQSGLLDEAEAQFAQARRLAAEHGTVQWLATIQALSGELAARRGRFADALRDLDAAMLAYAELERPSLVVRPGAVRARVLAELGDGAAARAAVGETRAAANAVPSSELDAKVWWDLAAAYAVLGEADDARACAAEAARRFAGDVLSMRGDMIDPYSRLPQHVAPFAYLQGGEVQLSLVD